jgi:chloramphenicol O-acetyltransferase
MKIKTNNNKRALITFNELTAQEREQFDYVKANDEMNEFDTRFMRYKGCTYDVHEFSVITAGMQEHVEAFKGWHGYASDSFFSGVMIRFVNNAGDEVIAATFIS